MAKVTKTIGVNGMSCSHCVHAVKTAVEGLGGVEKAEVSLEKKNVVVDYDADLVNEQQIKAAIEDQGYDVA